MQPTTVGVMPLLKAVVKGWNVIGQTLFLSNLKQANQIAGKVC